MLMFLALALTIPAVTVDVKLNGFPTAKTHSPILRLSELPKIIGCRLSASIFSNAISVEASAPITFALKVRLSLSVTSTSLALSTT